MDQSDASLWALVRTGNPDAFGVLFERHSKAIYTYCFRRVGDWAAAEDLLALVFLEAWRKRNTEVPDGKLLPWLYGIARNVVRNRRRSERRFAAALQRLPRPQPDPDFSDAAAERVDDELRMKHALAVLHELPRREQEVFVLCVWMELSYEDAAFALNIPIGTVRSRLFRAQARIRKLRLNLSGPEAGTQPEPADIEG